MISTNIVLPSCSKLPRKDRFLGRKSGEEKKNEIGRSSPLSEIEKFCFRLESIEVL